MYLFNYFLLYIYTYIDSLFQSLFFLPYPVVVSMYVIVHVLQRNWT